MDSTGKRKALTSDDQFNRFEDLPEALIKHIFSFLDMKQVIQTSILSKRYVDLWKITPSLYFNQELWRDRNTMAIDRSKFKHFVHKVLRRRGNSNIQILSISIFDFEMIDDGYVNKLILSALKRHHVEEIHLERVLLRPFSYIENVKSVVLKSVSLAPEGCSDNEFFFNLPVVEKFVLYLPSYSYLPGNQTVVINGPNLKFLVVRSQTLLSDPKCKIKIRAEKVVYLQLKGLMFDDYDLGQFDCLKTAEIDLILRETKRHEKCLNKLLEAVCIAKSLTMSLYSSQDSKKIAKEVNQLSMSFLNLKYLKLTRWSKNGGIGPLANLLNHFPSLQTLSLERLVLSDLLEETDWKAQFGSIFSQLESIEILDPELHHGEIRFLEYLLTNADGLKNITLKSITILPRRKEEKLIDFCEVLQEVCENASLNIVVRLLLQGRAESSY